MQNEPTLEFVAEAFREWRSNRQGRSNRTPEHLKQQTLELLEHHRVSHVIDALGLNSTTLKAWKNKRDGHRGTASDLPTFVTLPAVISETPVDDGADRLQVTLRINHGAQMMISGAISPVLLTAIVQGLPLGPEVTA